jgi:hypothetical protein
MTPSPTLSASIIRVGRSAFIETAYRARGSKVSRPLDATIWGNRPTSFGHEACDGTHQKSRNKRKRVWPIRTTYGEASAARGVVLGYAASAASLRGKRMWIVAPWIAMALFL